MNRNQDNPNLYLAYFVALLTTALVLAVLLNNDPPGRPIEVRHVPAPMQVVDSASLDAGSV